MAASNNDFKDVIERLGFNELRTLYYALGISSVNIEKWEHDAGEGASTDLKAGKVLECWRRGQGSEASRQALLNGLEKCRNKHAKQELDMLWNPRFTDADPAEYGLNCPICRVIFVERCIPKLMPCGHNVCESCLLRHYYIRGSVCVLCDRPYNITPWKMPINIAIQKLAETFVSRKTETPLNAAEFVINIWCEGRRVFLSVTPDTTVAQLELILQTHLDNGIAPHMMMLFYHGKRMSSSKTLSSYEIAEHHTIKMHTPMQGD